MNWNSTKAFFQREWTQVSTKIGLVLGAVSADASQYASFDHRIAYAGLIAAALLVLYREKPHGGQ